MVTVRGPHHCDVDPDVVEPDTVDPTPLDGHLGLQLHTEFDAERSGSLEVGDDDADVVHPLNRHFSTRSSLTPAAWQTDLRRSSPAMRGSSRLLPRRYP